MRLPWVLKHVLEKYNVSQYSLAKTLGVERTNVYRWVHEMRDPTAETLLDIVRSLNLLNHEAAEEFIEIHLKDTLKDNES